MTVSAIGSPPRRHRYATAGDQRADPPAATCAGVDHTRADRAQAHCSAARRAAADQASAKSCQTGPRTIAPRQRGRRHAVRIGAAAALVATLLGCSPRFDWRELRAADGAWVGALPDRPQTVTREVRINAQTVTLTVISTGVGPTLFAIGEARLPAALADAAALEGTIAQFAAALLRNIGAEASQRRALTPPPGARRAEEWRGRGRLGQGNRAVDLVARFIVADDRLMQLVAIGAEGDLPGAERDTFFDAFRLAGRSAVPRSPP